MTPRSLYNQRLVLHKKYRDSCYKSGCKFLALKKYNSFSGPTDTGPLICAVYDSRGQSNPDLLCPRLIYSHRIDFNIIRNWLLKCNTKHPMCRDRNCILPASLTLIDCHTRTLVYARNIRRYSYVALSYTWGDSSTNGNPSFQGNVLAKGLPLTIEDAIIVTKELNFRYLWCDRFCVPQGEDNSEERHQLINDMGRVYQFAQITIVAAVGENPSYGLSQLRGCSHSTYLFVLSFLLSLCALVYSTTVYIVRVTPIIQSIRLHTLLYNMVFPE